MSNNNVVKLIQPGTFDDQLTEILRTGSRSLLAHAVEAEVADFLANVSRGRVTSLGLRPEISELRVVAFAGRDGFRLNRAICRCKTPDHAAAPGSA